MTVYNVLYRKIYLFLSVVSFLCMFMALLFDFLNYAFFLEWNLGGSLIAFTFTIYFDVMSFIFLSVVCLISANVVMYSHSYLSDDMFKERFILLLSGFVMSMVILIISPNILSILLGWDGLGLVSYCLVIYYPTKKSSSAGMLTVLSNRVGDICLLISIAWISFLGEFNFLVLVNGDFSSLFGEGHLALLLVLGAMTKSAQVPFSAWLPAAMAAPTPVSALVHSSTLVTAGVYLLIRFSSFLSSNSQTMLLVLSVLTMFMAGLVASFEFDMKKIIALSTLSQLGVMMFSISLGLYTIAFFHLVAHALFKALLFLCAGSVIHGYNGSQDIRNFGSAALNYPLVSVLMNFANLSLCGIPFLSGFYSKDMVVEFAVQGYWNFFLITVMYISLGLTVFYSMRLTFFTFVNFTPGMCVKSIGDQDMLMSGPMVVLALFSLLSGPCLSNFLFLPTLVFLSQGLKTLVLFIVTILLMFSMGLLSSLSFTSFTPFSNFQGSMWGLPLFSGRLFSLLTLNFSKKLVSSLEFGWIEKGTIGGMVNHEYGLTIEKISSGSFKSFLLVFIFWFFLFILFL